MPKIDHDTKEKILAAAEKVFHSVGFKGTRTTAIAEEAGISRTMLHYYYSTKEELFQEVFKNTLGIVFSHLNRLMGQEMELEELLAHIIDTLSDLFEEKPSLPTFIVNILNEMPHMVQMLATNPQDNMPFQLEALLEKGKQTGKIADNVTGEDLILNIYGLCSAPYLGINYIKAKENRNDEDMKIFLKQRTKNIKTLIIKGIKP
jgi:TetR/AcrR family transcriptional regulator